MKTQAGRDKRPHPSISELVDHKGKKKGRLSKENRPFGCLKRNFG